MVGPFFVHVEATQLIEERSEARPTVLRVGGWFGHMYHFLDRLVALEFQQQGTEGLG